MSKNWGKTNVVNLPDKIVTLNDILVAVFCKSW